MTKTALCAIAVFIPDHSLKVPAAIAVLTVQALATRSNKPYESAQLNRLVEVSQIICIAYLMCRVEGLRASDTEAPTITAWVCLGVIISMQLAFLARIYRYMILARVKGAACARISTCGCCSLEQL